MKKDEFAENDALGGWIVDTEPMTAYSWMLAFGGGVLEEGNYRFLTPNNIDAFKFLRELSESNCAWQDAAHQRLRGTVGVVKGKRIVTGNQ